VKGGIKAGVKAASKTAAKQVGKSGLKTGIKLSAKGALNTFKKSIDDIMRVASKGKAFVYACFPAGTPVHTEFQFLIDAGSTWTTINGVKGRLFGTAPNQIFLPAAGRRDCTNGVVNYVGSRGFFWSNFGNDSGSASYIVTTSNDVSMGSFRRMNALSVRCVCETDSPNTENQGPIRELITVVSAPF